MSWKHDIFLKLMNDERNGHNGPLIRRATHEIIQEIKRRGIEIIALNDDPTILDPKDVIGQISVQLLADLTGVMPATIARRVVAMRKKRNQSDWG